MSYTKVLNYYLENDPYQKDISSDDRSRLIANSQMVALNTEESLYTPKTAADYIYFLASGALALQTPEGKPVLVKAGEYFGEEATLGVDFYVSKAIAKEPCHVIQILAKDFQEILKKDSRLHNTVLTAYSKKFINNQLTSQKIVHASHQSGHPWLSPEAGWTLSLLVPLFVYLLSKGYLAEQNARLFLTFSSAALCLWIFSLVPAYVSPLIIVTCSLALDLAPQTTILSGFGSENFLMLFSSLALGSAIASSNILYRMRLIILKFMPPTHFWTTTSVFISSALLTPLVPTSETRQKLLKPFTQDFIQQLGLSPSSSTTIKIALSAYAGATLLSPVFLTGSLYNFFVLTLLTTTQNRFYWYEWFIDALPAGLFLLVFFGLSLGIFFKGNEKITLWRERAESQLHVLGKMSSKEYGLCLLSLGYLAALMSQNYHGISSAYISMTMTSVLIIFNLVSAEALKKGLDWPSLFLFALLTGVAGTFNALESSLSVSPLTDFFDQLAKQDFASFALTLGLILTVARIFIPYGLTVLIATSLMLPFAQRHGINPWMVGFLILLFSRESLIPSFSDGLKDFMTSFSENNETLRLSVWKYHMILNLIKFAAVYFSISFWKDMSLI